jgi:hypothetical protein
MTYTRRSLLRVTIVLNAVNLILLIMLVCQLVQSEGLSSFFNAGVLIASVIVQLVQEQQRAVEGV